MAQDWDSFVRSIPHHRLVEIAVAAGGSAQSAPGPRSDAATRLQFFQSTGVDLGPAQARYASLGGDDGARAMNDVATGFTGLSDRVLDQLAEHAAWQVLAGHAIYGF